MFHELRKSDLVNHIKRQLDLQDQYERIRDLSSDPKEKERACGELLSIHSSIQAYLTELNALPGGLDNDLPSNVANLLRSYRQSSKSTMQERPAIRILFLASSPTNQARLRLDQEGRDIDEKLRLAQLRDGFDLRIKTAVRPQDLIQTLLDVAPQIVHFSGHGSSDGAIYLEDPSGKGQPVTPLVLGDLFKLVADSVECVILNACYSEAQAKAIAQHISFVIGMTHSVSDSAAIAFAVGFYQALGAGQPIDRAFEFGLIQIRLLGIPEHSTPVLLRRK